MAAPIVPLGRRKKAAARTALPSGHHGRIVQQHSLASIRWPVRSRSQEAAMTLRTLLCAVLVLSLTGCVAYGGGGRHYSPGWGNSGYRYDHDRWDNDYRRGNDRSVIIYQQGHERNYGSGYRYNPRPDSHDGHRYNPRDGRRDDRRHEQSRDNGRDRDRARDRDRHSQGNDRSVVPRQPRQEQAEHNRQGQRQQGQAEGNRQNQRQPQYSRQQQNQQRGNWQNRKQQDQERR